MLWLGFQLEGLCGKVLDELKNWKGIEGEERKGEGGEGRKRGEGKRGEGKRGQVRRGEGKRGEGKEARRGDAPSRSHPAERRFLMYVGSSSWRSKTAALARSKFGAPPSNINRVTFYYYNHYITLQCLNLIPHP
jgi:hypothetical protein